MVLSGESDLHVDGGLGRGEFVDVRVVVEVVERVELFSVLLLCRHAGDFVVDEGHQADLAARNVRE